MASGISGSGARDGEWAAECPPLRRNLQLLAPDEVELAKMLLNEGQIHLFEHWPEPGVDDDKKKSFFEQVRRLNSSYPGGLVSYIQNAKKLLADSKAAKNPYDGFTPSAGPNPIGVGPSFGESKLNITFCLALKFCVLPRPCFCCVVPQKCYQTEKECRANCLNCAPKCPGQTT